MKLKMTRRELLRMGGMGAAAVPFGGLVAACQQKDKPGPVAGATRAGHDRKTFVPPKGAPFQGTDEHLLDEIQRLVPGYDVSRIDLLAGNDQHTSIEAMGPGAKHGAAEIAPARNDLFHSGTLGRYSNALNSVMENKDPEPAEVPAD